MDFGTLLSKASENNNAPKKKIKYYSTKFEPPKKEQRAKTLSVNIQKFLAKQEHEETQKAADDHKRMQNLLQLRSKDKKAKKRVNVMVKRTKSANQSVIQDAVDSNNTAVTITGAYQPDADDYGYVSKSSAEFYDKMMEKYSKIPDKPNFNLVKKNVSTNLSSTKDRVKAALDKENVEPKNMKRKRANSDINVNANVAVKSEVKKCHLKAAPVINFSDLMKLAEKKQHESCGTRQEYVEEKRLLTQKQKLDLEHEKELRQAKKKRELARLQAFSATANRIPKLGDKNNKTKTGSEKQPRSNKTEDTSKLVKTIENKSELKRIPRLSKVDEKRESSAVAKVRPEQQSKPKEFPYCEKNNNFKLILNKQMKPNDFPLRDLKKTGENNNSSKLILNKQKLKEFPPRDLKKPSGNNKQTLNDDLKSKDFPPRDIKNKGSPLQDVRRKPKPIIKKGKFYDDDSEYDSEMDDFIDDGPEEEEDDYSKYISEIFGYDKRKYKDMEDDVHNMESSFAQQMREEVISSKMGRLEDLEDMKMEEEHKKRKAMMKRKYK